MSEDLHDPPGQELHRLLDEAFSGVAMTADAQDLKEEVRVNLFARVAELSALGKPAGDAALQALDELGSIRDLLDASGLIITPGGTATEARQGWAQARERHRVQRRPGTVLGMGAASLAASIGGALALLGATDVLALPTALFFTLVGIGATGVAWIVGETVARETATRHPLPAKRAGGYFLAALLGAYGLGLGGLVALRAIPLWAVALAVLGVITAIVLVATLGATQTNRRKAWVLVFRRERPRRGRGFAHDPAAGIRFGIYLVVIWSAAFAGFVVLGVTAGWAWSWLALFGGLVAMMLTVARMLFRSP